VRRFLVDTNVGWSSDTLERCAEQGSLAINPIIWAELAVGFSRIEELEAALPEPDWLRLSLPWSAGFLAGHCFRQYRKNGGARPRPLPDFYVGAHAAVERLTIVTRDAARYRTYFPTVEVVAPELNR
jgi:predicted nucleic acid-binding protein